MSVEVKAQNTISMTSVKAIADATEQSKQLLETMEQYAEDAGTSLTGIYADAESAKTSAESATQSADIAFTQLSIVENVVGVLNLISKHGDYQVTTDTDVVPDKWYFTRSGTAPNYVYTVVSNPTSIQYVLTSDVAIDPSKTYYTRSGSGTEEDPYVYTPVENPDVSEIGTYYECIYYELTGIDQAIQNYVSSHIVLDNDGLRLQSDMSGTSILLSALRGVVLYGTGGAEIASYGSTAVIGNKSDFHIEIDNQEIGFYQGSNRVAYMNGAELYVENSLSFGSFVFVQRQNGHFTLKLID